MKTYSVNGTYGSNNIPCTVFVAVSMGKSWYAVEGSVNVNQTVAFIEDGVNVEELQDIDCFTWSAPINCIEDLELAVEG